MCGIFEGYGQILSDFEQKFQEEISSRLKNTNETLREGIKYCLFGAGKRLRPVLLLKAAEASGANERDAFLLAAAIECIHCYSLVHDDLPALDNDDLRRGKLSAHKKFGEGQAILIGDAALNLSIEIVLSPEKMNNKYLKAARAIFGTAGADGMLKGQSLDISTDKSGNATLAAIKNIHIHKTAVLLSAAIGAGLRLGNSSEKLMDAALEASLHLGLAYQIADDLKDFKEGRDADKFTYPKILGKENAETELAVTLAKAYYIIKPYRKLNFLVDFAKYIKDSAL